MSSSCESRPAIIGTLLGDSERRSVTIPRFQRGFSWENSQVSTSKKCLMQTEFLQPNFLGPIVLQDESDEIILLDGQQRLSTATILLACIRDIARNLNETKNHMGADLARDIQVKFIAICLQVLV